jgi:outer membrane protein insertion porin family
MILDVQVSGNNRIDRDLILATCGLRIGDTFSIENVSNAIRTLYQLNVFDDVNISAEEINNGLRIFINVVEQPVVTRINYEGVRNISNSRLEELSIIRVGTAWSEIVQAENTRRLINEYRSKGYNLARINYRVRPVADGVDIRVTVDEGRKIVVRRINIFGNREIETRRILSKMKTKPRGLFRSGTFDNDKYQEDLRAIIDFYQEQGFIDARVLKIEESLQEDRFLTLNIYVEEGMQYRFGSIDVRGNQHFDRSAILSRFTMIEDEIFNMESFNRQLSSVASMYYEEGFIYFQSDPQIRKDENIVNISIVIEENTRAKIHKIHILGNSRTKEKVIRRQITVAPGDYFRQSRVIRSQQNVYNLGFFEPDMGLDYSPINENGDVDLFITVTDRASGSANGGIGYNSRDSLVGQFSIAHNNLWGNHWQTSIRWEYSSRSNQNIEFEFTNPYLFDTDLLFGFNLYHTRRDWIDSNFRVLQNGGGIILGYPIKALDFSRVRVGYSLYTKEYEIRNDSRPVSPIVQEHIDRGQQTTSKLQLTLSRDSRDNIFFPTSGSRITLYGEIAGGVLGGDFDFYKQTVDVSWFTPIIWSTVLRTRWRVGYIDSYGSNPNGVPLDERFYLGGTGLEGIRGYGDRSIHPGEGGLRSILFSTELGFPITSDQLIGLFFLDTGDCYYNFTDFNFKDFNTGAGAGIRIRTPFGLIGFDMAWNFEFSRWEPHFQFGTTF